MNKKMISLEVSEVLREALRREAFKNNTNISSLIRNILEKELKDEVEKVINDMVTIEDVYVNGIKR